MPRLAAWSRLPILLASLFLLALALRVWRLGQFNTLVFDEVFYVRFAVDYLQQQPFFDAHPPLSKYLIAVGIALVNPLTQALGLAGNTEAGIWLSPWSYRWVTALAGACLPPLVALLAYWVSAEYGLRRLVFGGVAGGLMLLEGLTLVESRFGLINIYWLLFGLLGQVCVLGAARQRRRWAWLWGAGLAFGCAIAIKWNGAGFLLGIYLLWGLSRFKLSQPFWQKSVPPAVAQLTGAELLVYGGVIPLVTYTLLWLPHLQLMGVSLLAIHGQLWQAHQFIGNSANAHPYCAAWYTWPLLLRPVAYFYRSGAEATADGLLPGVYSVQGVSNPILWWLSTAAIVALLGRELSRWRDCRRLIDSKRSFLKRSQPQPEALTPIARTADSVAVFLLVNYGANWLPWALVQRCTFLYHYMGALAFSVVAIAYLLTRWLTAERRSSRRPALILLSLMLLAFFFWLPLYLGLRLSPEALGWRWWLKSWI